MNVQDIVIPTFERTFVKVQPKGERKFTASGPKADVIIRHLLAGTFTTDEIVTASGASASRVSECRWALEAAGIEYTVVKKSAKKAPGLADAINETLAALADGTL